MLIPGLLFLAGKGFDYSIEFTGGTMVQVQLHHHRRAAAARRPDAQGIKGAEIQQFGAAGNFMIRARVAPTMPPRRAPSQAVQAALERELGRGSTRWQGGRGGEPQGRWRAAQQALLAVLLSFRSC